MKHPIKIQRYEHPKVDLLYKGEKVGVLNNHEEIMLVQIEIAKIESEDYSLVFEGKEIPISYKGELYSWPKGMSDKIQGLFLELQHAREQITRNINPKTK